MAQDLTRSGRPADTEWHPFQRGYLMPWVTPSDDIATALEQQLVPALELLRSVPAPKETFRYAPGKWSLREVVGHIADTERILTTRALAASRRDPSPYPPFDEDAYAAASGHDAIPLHRLMEQVVAVRRSTLALIAGFDHDAWRGFGFGKGHRVSARAWIFAAHAHTALHLGTIRSKYLA
jgi:hypothetical protein